MKAINLLLFVLLFASCGTRKRGAINGGTNSNSGLSDSQILNKMISDKQKKDRLKNLLKLNYRSPSQEAELKVLKRGGTQREAQLAAKKYEKGLTDIEVDELNYLEEGSSQREAELRAKEDNLKLGLLEKEELNALKFGKAEDSSASSQSSQPGLSH